MDLDRRFRDMLQRRLIPDLWGREACEHRFPLYHKYLGFILNRFPQVVTTDSGARYFGDVRLLPDTDVYKRQIESCRSAPLDR